MKTHANILYRLARFLAGTPPDALGAMVIIALERPELIAALSTVALFALFVLKFIVASIIGGIVTWYLKRIFEIHIWPKLSRKHQKILLRIRDRALLKKPD